MPSNRLTLYRLILIMVLTLPGGIAFADEYTIVAGSIEEPVTISVPDTFRLASQSHELKRKDRILDVINANESIRATFTELFRSDWSTIYPYPVIYVSTLYTTQAVQGSLSWDSWVELRDLFREASWEQVRALRRKKEALIANDMPMAYDIDTQLIWAAEDYPDRVIIMSLMELEVEGTRYSEIGARVICFFDGYLVMLDFKEDASKPNAAARLRDWVEATKIISIGQ